MYNFVSMQKKKEYKKTNHESPILSIFYQM